VIDFSKDLNPVQYEAVTYMDGPLLVVAGAGSGKTRILTYRVAYLASQQILPSRILAVTFTNKAAGEMARRVDSLVHTYVPMSTFHSFCLKVLRRENDRIPYEPNFIVYDKSDQLTLIKDCMRRLNISEKHTKPRTFANAISKAKDKLITAEEYAEDINSYLEESIANVYREYEKALLKGNAMDFDDLIMRCVELLEADEQVLEKYQNKFDHMLVDEFQDTNHAQYRLTWLLTRQHRNVCVVGDPDQSIYRFRGADIRNILEFERDFPEAKLIMLEENYRSTSTILSAANKVIANNTERKDKNLWTNNDPGGPIRLYRAADEHDEARFVVDHIQQQIRADKDLSLNDIVVFYRVHALSRVLEEEFRRSRLPYTIIGDVSFYNRREIKDIVAYLRVAVNPSDDVNLRRIINVPLRGIGETTQEAIAQYARASSISMFDALKQAKQISRLGATTKKRVLKFLSLLEKLEKEKNNLLPTEFINLVLDQTQYIDKMCGSEDIQDRTRVENIRELISAAADYENTCTEERATVAGFLHEIALTSDIDTWNDRAENITLMTIHNAKGLEFPIVHIVGLEEDLFPHFNALDDTTDIEEERRLCYVGMTRAKSKLTMSCAYHRTIFGQRVVREPSRFLSELPKEFTELLYCEHQDTFADTSSKPEPVRKKSANNGEYKAGIRVSHSHFGTGVVESVSGSGDAARLTIQFDSLPNPKVLVAKYAKLKILK
jgi:DNA helicase-2/ATP-dependent DNA helicase PcrA